MPNFIEKLIEKMINDGIITESELNQRIEEAKENSPLASLPALQDGMSFLLYDSMLKDFSIEELKAQNESLQSQNSELAYMVMMGGL